MIAGLPDINIDDQKLSFTVAEFKEEIYSQLTMADKKLFDLFFLKYDNSNLLAYLNDKDAVLDVRGNYGVEALDMMVKMLKDGDVPSEVSRSAPYISKFLTAYISSQPITEGVLWDDQLASLYYKYAMKANNKFVSSWYKFNLNLNNMLIASTARKYHFDASSFIVGDNEIANALRTSSARDWGLTGTFDYLETVQRVSEESDPLERERKIDLIKWNWLEDQTFFHYFTIERIFAYLLQLEIIERWYNLDKKKGEKQLREMIARMKTEVKMPEDFE